PIVPRIFVIMAARASHFGTVRRTSVSALLVSPAPNANTISTSA
ncbi:hypothetical protein GCK32_022354, partial [Trichostrongylus colubriformis]